MSARRACEGCGTAFVPSSPQQRFHSKTCWTRAHRGSTATLSAAAEVSLVEVTRRVLEEADRVESPAGVTALLLAAKLDKGGDTGSAMAALAKQHQSTLDEALKDAPRAADRVDELRERRQKRIGVGA